MQILVIEDDTLLSNAISFKIKKQGYDVKVCEDGKSAIEFLKNHTPGLVVTDLMLPFINGLEIISYIRNEIKLNIPIIVLSSVDLEKTVLEAFELGADDFITKPFSPNELIIRIKKLLRNVEG